jgi:Hemerythrin HHE cation binding domain
MLHAPGQSGTIHQTMTRRKDMTTKDTADRTPETIDFTMMYMTHDAFRRDLGRFTAAAAAGRLTPPGSARAGRTSRPSSCCTTASRTPTCGPAFAATAGLPAGLALLDEMEAEHAQIEPLLAAVDDALVGSVSTLSAPAAGLASALEWHLKHEEDAALPLIQSVCTPADWRAFAGAMRRRQGVKGAAIYVPWILDGTAPDGQRRFLAALPAPVRVISRRLWEPRYLQRDLWRA